MQVGSVIRIFEKNLQKVKWFLIIADKSGELATVLINTEPKPQHLSGVQALQLPLSKESCPCLDHDSHVDCSEIHVRPKGQINEILQKDPGREMGICPQKILEEIIRITKGADTIEPILKKKFGLFTA